MLPKFLLADNSQELPDTIFVVHTKQPRFIVECDIEGFYIDQVIHWLDDEPQSEALTKELLDLAEEFMETELESQEEMFNEDEE